MKGPVLLIQGCRISMALTNKKITGRSPGVDPILIMSQKPEILNQNNVTHCNKHLQVRMFRQRDML